MAEILTLIQTQVNQQEPTALLQSNEAVKVEAGLFDALMNELSMTEAEGNDEIPFIENDNSSVIDLRENIISFKSSNSFSQSVIDILAENSNLVNDDVVDVPEIQIQEEQHEIPEDLKPEVRHEPELNEKDEEISENDTKIEIKQPEILKSDADVNTAEKIIPELHTEKNDKPIKSDKKDDDEEENISEDVPEISNENINLLGIAEGNLVLSQKSENIKTQAEPQKINQQEFSTSTLQNQNIHFQNQRKNIVNQNPVEPVETEKTEELKSEPKTKFSEVLENRENITEDDEQKNFSNSSYDENRKNENNSQNKETKTASSQFPEKKKIETQTSSSNKTQSSNNEKISTNSHNNFQGFFEGVLNNRRTVSQNSPLPLNLRAANFNLTQPQTLREGLTNTVRFIRADGVQKASIVVDPPALGRISVELTSGTSGVEASIKVSSEQVRQLVQDQISQLRMNLSEQGVQVAEFTVDVQQDNNGHGGQNNSQENYQRRQQGIIGGVAGDETEEFQIDLEEGLLYWVA